MRFRNVALLYAVVMAAVLVLLLFLVPRSVTQRDMTAYNALLNEIAEDRKNGATAEELSAAYGCILLSKDDPDYTAALNTLYQQKALVMDDVSDGVLLGKIAWENERAEDMQARSDLMRGLLFAWAALFLAGLFFLLLLYRQYFRPFIELQDFASRVAKGDLDLPLPIRKGNPFGAFSESFDLMREELKAAREREYLADRSKKELVAELSHDIKTPVATIRATCEVLSVQEQDTAKKEKLSVITAKADTIDALVGNLFSATLEELTVLSCDPVPTDARTLAGYFSDLKAYGEIVQENKPPECLVLMDPLRMEQVIDNLVNNAYKYAGTPLFVRYADQSDGVLLTLRDQGPGVPEEELFRITEKYFRGSNAEKKQGSGLGLYLAKWFMEKQGGGIACYNDNGFVVELFLKKA